MERESTSAENPAGGGPGGLPDAAARPPAPGFAGDVGAEQPAGRSPAPPRPSVRTAPPGGGPRLGRSRAAAFSRPPAVSALRRAARREKALAVCGLLLALAGGLAAMLLLPHPEAGPGGVRAAPLALPAVGRPAALALIVLGAAFMDFGWPLYRLTVIVSGLAMGAALAGAAGWAAGGTPGLATGAMVGAVLGALAAWPAEVLVRTLSGCLGGLLAGLAAGSAIGGGAAALAGAAAGLLAGGLLTFLAFRALMMTVYAVTGGALIVYGTMSLYAAASGGTVRLTPVAALAAAGLAAVGILTQHALAERIAAGRAQAQRTREAS